MQAVYQWFPGFGSKVPNPMPHEHSEMACSKQRPTLNLTAPSLLKRTRSGTAVFVSSNSNELPSPKRAKMTAEVRPDDQALPAAQEPFNPPKSSLNNMSSPCQTAIPPSNVQLASPSRSGSDVDVPHRRLDRQSVPFSQIDQHKRRRAQDKLRSQFDLEILLKHDELRLIEQELGKVQITLEQLRRCRQLPFPGDADSPVTFQQAISNSGPSVALPEGVSQPRCPAPYGVNDGPYSRHYARWLISHPDFDSELRSTSQPATERKAPTSLALRSGAEPALPHRRQRNSTGGIAPGSGLDQHPQPKEKAPHGPQVLRRSDGQLVKLKCRDCGKEDVSSVQGFLNHCRIAHQNDMKSHADAASICGVPVDEAHELDNVLLSSAAPSEPNNQSPTTQRTPAHVHPLISFSSAPTASRFETTMAAPRPSGAFLRQMSPINPKLPNNHMASEARISTEPLPFTISGLGNTQPTARYPSSSIAPSLSALARKAGLGNKTDLDRLFVNAKERIDLEQVESLADSDVDEELTTTTSISGQPQRNADSRTVPLGTSASRISGPGARMPTKPPSIEVPISSRKFHVPPDSQSSFERGWPSSSPPVPGNTNTLSPYTFASQGDAQMTDLSPRTNPPGLVTDHEDDEEDMEDEAKSVFEHPNECQTRVQIFGDHGDLDIPTIGNESKDVLPTWCLNESISDPLPTVPNNAVEKKRRGRPKKGKAKLRK